MKKFTFSLLPLLEQRRQTEEAHQLAVSQAHQNLTQAETTLNAHRMPSRGTVLTAADFQALDSFQTKLTSKERTIKNLREILTLAQTALQHATRERKIIERLRDHRLQTRRETQRRTEEYELDEANKSRTLG